MGVPQTQAPAIPSTSDLAALSPAVAITLLVVVAVSIVAFYVGPIVRARFTQPPAPSSPASAGAHALREPPPQPIDRATGTAQQFIDHLLRLQERDAARIEELERRLTARDREIDELQEQVARLNSMLWQQQRRPLG